MALQPDSDVLLVQIERELEDAELLLQRGKPEAGASSSAMTVRATPPCAGPCLLP